MCKKYTRHPESMRKTSNKGDNPDKDFGKSGGNTPELELEILSETELANWDSGTNGFRKRGVAGKAATNPQRTAGGAGSFPNKPVNPVPGRVEIRRNGLGKNWLIGAVVVVVMLGGFAWARGEHGTGEQVAKPATSSTTSSTTRTPKPTTTSPGQTKLVNSDTGRRTTNSVPSDEENRNLCQSALWQIQWRRGLWDAVDAGELGQDYADAFERATSSYFRDGIAGCDALHLDECDMATNAGRDEDLGRFEHRTKKIDDDALKELENVSDWLGTICGNTIGMQPGELKNGGWQWHAQRETAGG